jgi:hypothetical protein
MALTRDLTTPSEKIITINHWVYRNQGFAPNDRYFLIPDLGPTPIQVLESGGDCGDKSRLVSAMLRQLGIASGLVQIFPCRDCSPIHTVVEAEYEGGRMVVDPIWDVDYPSGDARFLGVEKLAGSSRGREHIADLQSWRGAWDKIQMMPSADATFDYALGVNWQKNTLSRSTAIALRLLGYAPEHLLRPHFFEDPKLALVLSLLAIAGAFVVVELALFLAVPGLIWRLRPWFFWGSRKASAVCAHEKHE